MRRAAAAFALAAAPLTAIAQSTRGVVISRQDGAPVVAASILAQDGRIHGRTDARGFFVIPGRGDTLVVRAIGFRERRVARVRADTVALEPVAAMLDRVVTTAGQRSIKLSESVASVDVLGRKEIDAAAAVSASQLLRTVPGLQEIATPPSRTTIAIRGLDGARVLVLVDGEPVPGTLIETRDIGRLSTLAAERVEVTRGPSSVEFGSDALGGVINLVTAAPAPELSGSATVRIGELGRRESSAEISNTHGALGYRISGGWRQADRIAAVDAEGSSLERVYDVRADARYRASDRVRWRTSAQLSRERQRWPVGGGYNGFIDNRAAQLLAESQIVALGGVVRVRGFAQYSDYQFRQSQQSVPISGSADSLEQQERLGRGLLSYSTVVGAHTIDAGAQYAARDIVSPGKIDGGRAHDRVTELFVRDAWTRGALLITGGARSTSSSLWGHALNPSVGAAVQLRPSVRLRLNAASGFRAPSFKDVRYTFTNAAAGYVIEGNSGLEPERSTSVEAGIDWAPRQPVLLELGAFRTRVRNLIDTRFIAHNSAGLQVFRNQNVGRAHLDGVEASASLPLFSGTATVAYNFLRARDAESGARLDRRAAHSATGSFERRVDLPGPLPARWSVRAHYLSAAPVGALVQAERVSVDVHLRVDISAIVEFSAGANNLFDRRPDGWTPAFQRQFFAGLRLAAPADRPVRAPTSAPH